MCGIAGFIDCGCERSPYECLIRMTNSLRHRGPDAEGYWLDKSSGIAMGHRRLSILDLSEQGHQPMHSASGRYVIVFNGEIYNFLEIRKELDAISTISWRGRSDTEVMLAAIETWGLEEAVKRFIGMFAFAMWDRRERVLSLVRDRVGEKPLYYGWSGKTFLFGSELKALSAHPTWHGEIDHDALALFLRHNYIPAPYSIFQNIYKLMPGTILSIRVAGREPACGHPVVRSYWSAREVTGRGSAEPYAGTEAEAIGRLDYLLRNSIRQQMVADVPLGAFLSGGIDSSTVVALMQAQSSQPVKSFTIGFREWDYNEAEHAKSVAQHLGTEHTELYVTPRDALEVIPRLPVLYDEPFSDSSQIPTFLVSELTRKHVTVSLSGDGGDELFGGYNRYITGQDIWNKIKWMPLFIRRTIAFILRSIPGGIVNSSFPWEIRSLSKYGRPGPLADKLRKMAQVLEMDTLKCFYEKLFCHWKDPGSVMRRGVEPPSFYSDLIRRPHLKQAFEKMMYLDLIGYLPDDILVKVDRAAMGVSLETRVPFLDHRIIEFAWRVPLSMKIRDGQGKWLLRQVLYKYVPRKLVERPKTGFGVPIDAWLRGPLREWAESLLDERLLKEEGHFNPLPILVKWTEHKSGRDNWQYLLWDILMFQAWLEEWKLGHNEN